MADLTRFVNSALRQGNNIDVYLNRWPSIGNGRANVLETLHANLTVHVKILNIEINGDIDIVMPDTSPSGSCRVNFLGNVRDNCPYRTFDNKIEVRVADRTLTLYPGDKAWTWLDVSGVPGSIGIWPANMDFDEEGDASAAGA